MNDCFSPLLVAVLMSFFFPSFFTVSRQNSVANGIGLGYNNNAMTSFTRNGPDDGPAGAAGATMDDEVFTEYGSIVGSFPPSPTLSFRSAIDAPGFNR